MECFRVVLVCFVVATALAALSPTIAHATLADDCDDCRQVCADDRQTGLEFCDASYEVCCFYCLMWPFEHCEDLCIAALNLCDGAVALRFAQCMRRCNWWPCCENNPCDDGLYCNGLEWCAPEFGECAPGEPVVCESDGLFCNGVEACDDALDQCASPGDPCAPDATCDEQTDTCTPIADDDDDDDDDDDADDDDDDDDADDNAADDDDDDDDDDSGDDVADDDDGGCGG
jgi:hypothetical protein